MRFPIAPAVAATVFALWFIAPVRAEVPIPGRVATVSLWNSDAGVATDPSGLASLDAMRSAPARFVAIRGYLPALQATFDRPVVYWFRLPDAAAWSGWYLGAASSIDSADLYVPHGAAYDAQHFGTGVPFADRTVPRLEPTVLLPAGMTPGAPAYIRAVLRRDGEQLNLQTPAAVAADDAALRFQLIYPMLAALSICLALGIANLVFFAFLRDRSLLYASFVMLSAVLQGLTDGPGLAWSMLWPHASVPYSLTNALTLYAAYAFDILFSRRFLSLPKRHPAVNRALLVTFVVYVLLDQGFGWRLPSEAFGGNMDAALSVTDVLFEIIFVGAGIAAWRGGQSSARFYVLAYSGMVVGVSLDQIKYALPVFGQSSLLFPYCGEAWEGIFLLAALADKLNQYNRERLRVKEANVQAQQAAIEQARRHSEEIEYAFLHDALTGLPNKRRIDAELAQLGDTSPEPGKTHALAYIDLDHFKVVNDSFGHTAGDQLLISVAERLREITPPGDILARLGSDGFVVIIKNELPANIAETAERLREAIATIGFVWDQQKVPVSASIGLAVLGQGATTPDSLLSLADAACDDAKDTGRNRVQAVIDQLSATRTRRDMDWVTRIAHALDEQRFRLYAQSIVPLDGRAEGLRIEVLIRMSDPGGRVIGPSNFLPAAERYGLMSRLDAWVIDESLRQCAAAARRGALESLSVNLSGAFLRRPDALSHLQRAIDESEFPPARLCLEITETVVATSLGNVINLIGVLGERGVHFALDDFGTGTSSLALLKRLNVNYVKIDGSFVRDCARNTVDATIIDSIVRLAGVLKMHTVAEYVGDEATVARVRGLGIEFGQGWAFDQPGPLLAVLSSLGDEGFAAASR